MQISCIHFLTTISPSISISMAPPPLRRSCPDWSSGLPPELLESIAKRLPSSLDYVCFRSVCSHWRSAAQSMCFAPFLMLPFDPDTESITFYSVSDEKALSLMLPDVRDKVICGVSHGWLALMDDAASMMLLNPFTRVRVELPPADERIAAASRRCVSMMDGRWVLHSEGGGQLGAIKLAEMRSMFFQEIMLSSAPDSGFDCVAMATLASSMHVAFCRVGDSAWTLLDTNLSCCVSAVVYCQERFLAMSCIGESATCDVGAAPRATPMASLTAPAELCHRSYLDVNGELHLVAATVEVVHEAQRFIYWNEVYKSSLKGELMWSKVDSIDDLTLFVSKHFASSFIGRNVFRCKQNCIYFSEPLYEDQEHCLEMVDIVNGTSELAGYHQMMQASEAVCWFRPNLWAQGEQDTETWKDYNRSSS